MKLSRVILLVAVIAGAVGIIRFVQSSNKSAAEQEKALAAFEQEQKVRANNFRLAMDELEKKKLIPNSAIFKSEFENYYAKEGRTDLMSLATSTYRANPATGLRILEEVCIVFEANAEMSEWISDEINPLLRQNPQKFAEGLTSLDESKFNCLPRHIDFAWGADDQGEDYDPKLESHKLAAALKKGKFADSPNVKKLVEQLEGA